MQYDDAALLRTFMARDGVNQVQVAKNAGVSQATISRALKGSPERRGKARVRLFTYVRAELARQKHDGQALAEVVRAFEGIWDGSEVHASAVARVIDAMDGLLPKKD